MAPVIEIPWRPEYGTTHAYAIDMEEFRRRVQDAIREAEARGAARERERCLRAVHGCFRDMPTWKDLDLEDDILKAICPHGVEEKDDATV